MADEVPVRVLAPGVSGLDGIEVGMRPRPTRKAAASRPAPRPAPAALTDWTLARALELRRRALEVGSAKAAAEFQLPIGRVLPVLASFGLDLSRPPAPTPAPAPRAAAGAPGASSPAPESGRAPGAAPGRRRRREAGTWTKHRALEVHGVYRRSGLEAAARYARAHKSWLYVVFKRYGLHMDRVAPARWTAERAGELHRRYQEEGIHAAAAWAGVTPMRAYQVLAEFDLPRLPKGAAVHLAAVRRHARVPAGSPRGSVSCPKCGHVFVPQRPSDGLEV